METSEARPSVGSGPERPAATKEQQEREEQRTCETWPIRVPVDVAAPIGQIRPACQDPAAG
jgi:hypothetical protein